MVLARARQGKPLTEGCRVTEGRQETSGEAPDTMKKRTFGEWFKELYNEALARVIEKLPSL